MKFLHRKTNCESKRSPYTILEFTNAAEMSVKYTAEWTLLMHYS